MLPALSHSLPRLATSGNRIVIADTREAIFLRGVNRSGLEYSQPGADGFFAAAHLSDEEFDAIILQWGANVIRLPFNQQWALEGNGPSSAEDYLSTLDRVIEAAARRGAYTILDLQWLNATEPFGYLQDGQPNFVPPLPNAHTPLLWRTMAERYKDEPAVLFDLFNEPHSRIKGDDRPLNLISDHGAVSPATAKKRRVSVADWKPWALHLSTEIRKAHPLSVIFVSGVDWAHDLRGLELNLPNIVYSAHVYPNRSPALWQRRFGHIGQRLPLFIGEWGGVAKDLQWGQRLHASILSRCCGWAAWSWMDQPVLVEDARHGNYRPTPFGALVKQALSLPPGAALG